MRRLIVVAALAGCIHSRAAKTNELVAKSDARRESFRAPIASATFCKTCGRDAPVTLTFGAPPNRIVVAIPNCYPHAHSHLGDHDQVTVTDASDNTTATEGELDLDDCITSRVIGKLSAKFASGLRVDVKFDTPLVEPSASP